MGAERYPVRLGTIQDRILLIRERLPVDFMFRLTPSEKSEVVANCDHLASLKFSKVLPHAFTEHGAIMAASVLNSQRAVEVSVFIVRAFVGLRRFLAGHAALTRKLAQMDRRLADHDGKILVLMQAINKLASPEPLPKGRRIGFRREPDSRS